MPLSVTRPSWSPLPGAFALLLSRASRPPRVVKVVAEAVGGRMCVEAVGKKGVNVRLTVKRESLREPEPGLF